MRMVDDYLIVTESKEEALAIYETIRQGNSVIFFKTIDFLIVLAQGLVNSIAS